MHAQQPDAAAESQTRLALWTYCGCQASNGCWNPQTITVTSITPEDEESDEMDNVELE